MNGISLQPVTRDNWHACIALKPADDQRGHLATNLETIAESKFEPHYVLRAICKGDAPVGMLAYCREVDEPTPEVFWLFRLMIDVSEQRKGFARAAVGLAVDEMKEQGAGVIRTMHTPSNTAAHRLYTSLGFTEAGIVEDGDVMLQMEIQA